MPGMKISIVIATYNRGQRLLRTLQSLADQSLTPADWEAIAVDNNSADDTFAVFSEFASAHPFLNLRMVREPRQGLSWARNRGIAEARGEIIAIIDDDEEVNPGFADGYVDFFARHPAAAMAGGRVVPLYEAARPRWMSRWTERPIAGTLDLGTREKTFDRGYPAGGNLAVTRSTIERYGAFDTSLGRTGSALIGGEEKELCARILTGGGEVWWTPVPTIFHIIPAEKLTLEYFLKLARGVGRSEKIRLTGISEGARIGSRDSMDSKDSDASGTLESAGIPGADPGEKFGRTPLYAVAKEVLKWGATLALAAWFVATLRPDKARYLIIMRVEISRGLLSR